MVEEEMVVVANVVDPRVVRLVETRLLDTERFVEDALVRVD